VIALRINDRMRVGSIFLAFISLHFLPIIRLISVIFDTPF
jgi:hypothetical protein